MEKTKSPLPRWLVPLVLVFTLFSAGQGVYQQIQDQSQATARHKDTLQREADLQKQITTNKGILARQGRDEKIAKTLSALDERQQTQLVRLISAILVAKTPSESKAALKGFLKEEKLEKAILPPPLTPTLKHSSSRHHQEDPGASPGSSVSQTPKPNQTETSKPKSNPKPTAKPNPTKKPKNPIQKDLCKVTTVITPKCPIPTASLPIRFYIPSVVVPGTSR